MTISNDTTGELAATSAVEPRRPLLRSLRRGFAGRCPACGHGRLFSHGLMVCPHCPACGEALHHHRADDLPPYLNILLTGHVVVGTMLLVMTLDIAPMGWLMAATLVLTLATAFALMRPLKGAVVAAQWAMAMHGFGGDES